MGKRKAARIGPFQINPPTNPAAKTAMRVPVSGSTGSAKYAAMPVAKKRGTHKNRSWACALILETTARKPRRRVQMWIGGCGTAIGTFCALVSLLRSA
jgi:hypothetical protein